MFSSALVKYSKDPRAKYGNFEIKLKIQHVRLGADFLSSQKLLAAILLEKKSIMQELVANISKRICIVKIVYECFLP